MRVRYSSAVLNYQLNEFPTLFYMTYIPYIGSKIKTLTNVNIWFNMQQLIKRSVLNTYSMS